MPHPASLPLDELLAECNIRRQKRSGPGGQHRNKVETAIFIEHTPTGVTAEASERRSQEANRQQAITRLRTKLAIEVRSQIAKTQSPSELWVSRCRGGKIIISKDHENFPALLAEALDHIHAHQWNVKSAALALGCSTSQLVRLFAKEPQAIGNVNEQRKREGLKPLK